MAAKFNSYNGKNFSDFTVKISLTPEERNIIRCQKPDWAPFKSRYDKYRNDLFNEFCNYMPEAFQNEEIMRSIKDAFEAHKYQFRKCGDNSPFITHPAAVAIIVADEIGAGPTSIIAALLHDVVEDTSYGIEYITEHFGQQVGIIVDGVTKVTKVAKMFSKKSEQAETFRNMLINTLSDYRVTFIKLSDRLHNMRTMEGMLENVQNTKSNENLTFFVPIAGILGMDDLRKELEDLSFKYTYKDKYAEMQKQRIQTKNERDKFYSDLKLKLLKVLIDCPYTFKIYTEEKSLYSAYTQMKKSGYTMAEYDSFESIKICFTPTRTPDIDIIDQHYLIYSRIIKNLIEKPGSKKDYLTTPKSNGFSALVFRIKHEGQWVEIEIITNHNDIVAHKGFSPVKSEWTGMDELNNTISDAPNVSIENMMRRLSEKTEPNRIYVFNNRDKIITLPNETTVLDFAIKNSPEEAMHSIGAYVNGCLQQLNAKLKNGDIVNEILTSPCETPKIEWLNWVTTEEAINMLNEFFKEDINTARATGEKILHNKFFAYKMQSLAIIPKLVSHFACKNSEDFYIQISQKKIDIDKVMALAQKIKDEHAKEIAHIKNLKSSTSENWVYKKIYSKPQQEISNKTPLEINSDDDYIIAHCCNPVPGDDAVAIKDDDGVIYIHKRDCKEAIRYSATDGKHITKVIWKDNVRPAPANIKIEGNYKKGIIQNIMDVLDKKQTKIKCMDLTTDDSNNTFGLTIKIYCTAEIIDDICAAVKELPNIQKVYRMEY